MVKVVILKSILLVTEQFKNTTMTAIHTPTIDTTDLQNFAQFLRDVEKFTDAQFIDNLVEQIVKHPGADKSCVDRWLRSAFDFPKVYEDYNCIDTYNHSFYLQIIGKIHS